MALKFLNDAGLAYVATKVKALIAAHTSNTSNPHGVTKAQVGLGNVDNTSDASKPVSTATQTALNGKAPTSHASTATTYGAGTGSNYGHVKLSDATNSTSAASSGVAASPKAVKSAYDLANTANTAATTAQTNLTSHTGNTSNPHGVTKSQVGLGNVPNVATNDQTPTYTAATTLATLTSGEKLSVSMGKIMKAITDLISHIGNTSNPHSVTKAQVGLGNVDNTADSAKSVSYATSAGSATKVGNNFILRFKGGTTEGTDQWTYDGSCAKTANITAAKIGAAPTAHASTATTYGIGTGSNYGHVKLSDSTSSTSAATAGIAASPAAVKAAYDLANGKANARHNHAASNITSGTLAVARGGTGVTSNPSMLTNLGSTSAASVFAASPRPGVTGVLPVANGGTGVSSTIDVLSTLGLNAVTVTGSASTLAMTANTMTKIALASEVAATYKAGDYFQINSGSLEITGAGVYLICGSVYVTTTAVSGGAYGAAGCFIKKTDGSGTETELTSANVDFPATYGRSLAVSTGIKLVYLADGDKLTLYTRTTGNAAGTAYPSNGATYLTAIRLCYTNSAV